MAKKIISLFVAMLLSISISAFSTVFAAEKNYNCTPSAEAGEDWLVGANVTVTPTSGSGFKMLSKDGTAVNSHIVWSIPITQLKKTPYFVINVKNTGSVTDGPYMRLIYYLDNVQDTIVNPDFRDPNLENWVRANSKTGLHCFNILEQLPEGTSDDSTFQFCIYQDPFETGTALEISELYLSATEVKAETSTNTSSVLASSQAKTSSTVISSQAEMSSVTATPAAEVSSQEASNTSGGEAAPSYVVPVVIVIVAVVVVAGVIVLIVMKKKKGNKE